MRILPIVLAAAGSAIVLAAVPARADRDDWHHAWRGRDHDWHRPDRWWGPVYRGWAGPRRFGYAYAPPPVVYGSPWYGPGITFGFTIR
jgi:hypothetical protein